MIKTVLVLPDGQELSSGRGEPAILSSTLTQCVNSETDIKLGSCCCDMVELTVLGDPDLKAGQEVTLLHERQDGTREQMGIFILEKPEYAGRGCMRLTAYDRVSLLDKDLTEWILGLDRWPYPLHDFAKMVCTACGLTYVNALLPNGSFPVQQFSAQGITGRQLISWIGEAAGRYAHATVDGALELTWYQTADFLVSPGGQGSAAYREQTLHLQNVFGICAQACLMLTGLEPTVEGDTLTLAFSPGCWYFQNGLNVQEEAIHPVQKVQIHTTDLDVGVIWPEEPAGDNTYRISGNPLLRAQSTQKLRSVLPDIYECLRQVSYTPCQVTVPDTAPIRAGQIIAVQDTEGRLFQVYVMSLRWAGGRMTLSCTGNLRRDSTTAVNNKVYTSLTGKVMELELDLEGLRAENRDGAGSLSRVELALDSVRAQVEKNTSQADTTQQRISALEQSSEELKLEFASIRKNGAGQVETSTGFTFNDQGLHIQKSGNAIANRMDHTGMYVTRSGTNILVANKDGVLATDLQAQNYLIIGDHARFQDYSQKRTACFYLG